ncbi:serine hydrolase [Sphingomonas gei]|nr:serine hydrolase [Sphingomonas gei]
MLVLFDRLRSQFPERLLDLQVWTRGRAYEVFQPAPSEPHQSDTSKPRYSVGCIEGLLQAITMEVLHQRTQVDLFAEASSYLPELRPAIGTSASDRLKVVHLLAHATGFHSTNKAIIGDWQQVLEHLRTKGASFPPGTVCSWNGLGRRLLEELIIRVTGKAMSELTLTTIGELGVFTQAERRLESSSEDIMLELDELARLIRQAFRHGGPAARLLTDRGASIPVIRHPVSPRSSYPIAYASGLAKYSSGLWGQNGIGPGYSLAIRFTSDLEDMIAIAAAVPPLARDLVISLVETTISGAVPVQARGPIGSVIGCDWQEVAGTYVADDEEFIVVELGCDLLLCSVWRGPELLARLDLRVTNGDILVADPRWSSFQVEFFKHPESSVACLTLGQVTYIRSV